MNSVTTRAPLKRPTFHKIKDQTEVIRTTMNHYPTSLIIEHPTVRYNINDESEFNFNQLIETRNKFLPFFSLSVTTRAPLKKPIYNRSPSVDNVRRNNEPESDQSPYDIK